MNTFLDAAVADAKKQQALEQVYANAPDLWKKEAASAVIAVAYALPEFTSDDVWKILWKPPESRALGPIIRKAAIDGYVEKTERRRATSQVSRHYTDVTIWKSLIYGAKPPAEWKQYLDYWKPKIQ